MELVKVSGNPLVYLNKAQEIMASVDSSMSSTDLRAARGDINNEKKAADKERTRLKKELLAEYERLFADIYNTAEIDSLHKEVNAMFNAALKKEQEEELRRIEELIVETNSDQVDRTLLPNAKTFKGKGDSYIISHIEEAIDAIIFKEDEVEVAPEPEPIQDESFQVTMTLTTTDKSLAREIRNLCRQSGVVVNVKKG